MADTEEIAIVGVGCRFPGADNLSEFWTVLVNGENHVKEIPKERWDVDAFYDPDPDKPGKTYVRRAGLIDRFDEWDHRCFGVSEVEASLMDPQQRWVLECVHMALEDAGITRTQINGTRTGVYIGVTNSDYKNHLAEDITSNSESSAYQLTGSSLSIVSARVAYVYNLLGPALSVDTACSSSLVAVNLGSQALRLGECDAAICGGVNLIMDPALFVPLAKTRMLSPTGQCQAFSANADGYARSEGCGIIMIKRLKDAVRDGNKIWATVKTSTNQDGHCTTPITAPSEQQQIDLLQHVYELYGVDKGTVQVIESHGTGTPVGDPVEASALGTFFSDRNAHKRTVYIGSVKSNIGHLESAAGIAGLIKVLLMMKNETIVPSLMYEKETENPKINFRNYGFIVPIESLKWSRLSNKPLVACVNSFGFGGTNAHAIIHEYTPNAKESNYHKTPDFPIVVTLSAFDEEALKHTTEQIMHAIQNNSVDLPSLAYTSTCKRDHLPVRKAFCIQTLDQLAGECQTFLIPKPDKKSKKIDSKVVFVLCGIGTVWNGMCKSLLDIPAFSDAITSIDEILVSLTGWTIRSKLSGTSDLVNDHLVAHISLFACQLGLAAIWKSLGVHPDAVVGQSIGEVAAAYISGKLDLAAAVNIVFIRSKFLTETTVGSMFFVHNIPLREVEAYCTAHENSVSIAVYNSPVSCVLSGTEESIEVAVADLEHLSSGNAVVKKLKVQRAYHSHHVDIAAKNIESNFSDIEPHESDIEMFSTVTGKLENSSLFSSAKYWNDNVRKPVLFGEAITSAASGSASTLFLEIGPGPVLHVHSADLFGDNSSIRVLSTVRIGNDIENMLQTACKLYEYGRNINWENIVPLSNSTSEYPKYVFQRQKTLFQDPSLMLQNQGVEKRDSFHLYIERLPDVANNPHFIAKIGDQTTPFVFEHVVNGVILVPGALHGDIGFEVGKAGLDLPVEDISVSLDFVRPIRMQNQSQLVLSVVASAREHDIEFFVKHGGTTVCKGITSKIQDNIRASHFIDINDLKISFADGLVRDPANTYTRLKDLGFEYGTSMRTLKDSLYNDDSCLVQMEVPRYMLSKINNTVIHPCILDAMFQSTCVIPYRVCEETLKGEIFTFTPIAIGAIMVQRKPVKHMFIFTKKTHTTILDTVVQWQFQSILLDVRGNVIASLKDFTVISKRGTHKAPYEVKYNLQWCPVLSLPPVDRKRFLVVTNSADRDLINEVQFEGAVVCHKDSACVTNEDILKQVIHMIKTADKKDERLEAIVVMFEEMKQKVSFNVEHAEMIYKTCKANCWFIIELIRCLDHGDCRQPVFVATRNTQRRTDENEQNSLDFVGSEVWGLVRAAQLEFVRNKLTLVDLQPSLNEARNTFLKFLSRSVENIEQSEAEVLIFQDQIFTSRFTQVRASESIPAFINVTNREKQHYSIRSILSSCVSKPHLLPIDKTCNECISGEDRIICMKLLNIYIHSSTIYPSTMTLGNNAENTWVATKQDGHAILGVEYIGLVIDPKENETSEIKLGNATLEDMDLNNNQERIAVFPIEMGSEVCIPRDCTVDKNDIPFYKPGLLMKSLLSWEICSHVCQQSNVVLTFETYDHALSSIMKQMLQTQKNARVSEAETFDETDIIVSIRPIENDHTKLQKARKIVCLKNAIPISLQRQLMITHGKEIIEIDTVHLFSSKKVSSLLPNIVKWLKEQFQSLLLENPKQTHTACNRMSNENSSLHTEGEDVQNVIQVSNLACIFPQSSIFDKSGTYIITGGLTGLGWELLRLLIRMGAGTVVTFNRRLVSADKASELRELESTFACKILTYQADVNNYNSLVTAISSLEENPTVGPIRGVFHGAGVLDPALMINMQAERLDIVMQPKILGTLNIHIATRHLPLDFFYLHSGTASIIGSPGLSSYCAANSFLDSFAMWRRSEHLPGQAVNWGALVVGMAADNAFADYFEKRGYLLLSVPEICSCFQQSLMQNSTADVFIKLDWNLVSKDYANPQMSRARMKMEKVLDEESSSGLDEGVSSEFDVELLSKSDAKTQHDWLIYLVLDVAKRVITSEKDSVSLTTTLAEIGMDSLSSVTFANVIYSVTHCRIDVNFMLNDKLTLQDIEWFLFDRLFRH